MPEEKPKKGLSVFIERLRAVRKKIVDTVLAHRIWFIVGFLVISSGLIVWARFGFTFEIGRFFAAPGCPQEGRLICTNNDVYELTDSPDGFGCGNVFIEDCGAGTCMTDSTGAHCEAPISTPTPPPPTRTPTPTPFSTSTPPPPTPTATPTPPPSTPTPTPAGGSAVPVFNVQNETWTPGQCDSAASFGGGQASADIVVSDAGANSTYVIWNTFHSNTAGCQPTSEGPSGGAGREGTCDFQAHESGTCRVFYNVSRHNCGRVQVDAAFSGGSVFIGQVINYGVDCVEQTPPPTTTIVAVATTTPPPTPTPTATPTPTPTPQVLACAPSAQTVGVSQAANMVATGGTGSYTWSAPSGSPSSGTGSAFGTTYASEGGYAVTVTSGSQSAQCSVTVEAEPQALECAPATQTVNAGAVAQVIATGGTGSYTWSAPSGSPSSGTGSQFGVAHASPGTYTVTVSDTGSSETDICQVIIPTTQTPPMTTLQGVPGLQISKLVRNVTQGSGQNNSVSATPGDTVQFTVTVTSTGTETARAVIARDTLPAGLAYVANTTTVDGTLAADTYTTSGISLGDLSPGRTVTIRFDARVSSENFFPIGSSTLVNTALARGSNVSEVSDVAFVVVSRDPVNPALAIQKFGRNVSQNQVGEHSSVTASPNDVIEFTVRIRNVSQTTATNVMVQDIVPGGVVYQSGTATLNGQPSSDALVSGGVNIGSLTPGQEAVVRFLGRVAAANVLPEGTTTLINAARTWADDISSIEAQVPIIITNQPITVPPVDTGPGETVALAVIISTVVTLLYVGYTSTDTFRRREVRQLSSKRTEGDFK